MRTNETVEHITWNFYLQAFVRLETNKMGVYDDVSTFNKKNVVKRQVLKAVSYTHLDVYKRQT